MTFPMLHVMLSGKVGLGEFSEEFDGCSVVSDSGIQLLYEPSEDFEFPVDRYSGSPIRYAANTYDVDALELGRATALLPVGAVLRGRGEPEIRKRVGERFLRNSMIHLNLGVGDPENEPVHKKAGLQAVFSSALLRLFFWIRNGADGVILLLIRYLHGVPVPLHEPIVQSRVNDSVLSSGEGNVSNGWVIRMLDRGSLAPAIPALLATPSLQFSAMRARVVVFGMFDKLRLRLDSLMFVHGVGHGSTSEMELSAIQPHYSDYTAKYAYNS